MINSVHFISDSPSVIARIDQCDTFRVPTLFNPQIFSGIRGVRVREPVDLRQGGFCLTSPFLALFRALSSSCTLFLSDQPVSRISPKFDRSAPTKTKSFQFRLFKLSLFWSSLTFISLSFISYVFCFMYHLPITSIPITVPHSLCFSHPLTLFHYFHNSFSPLP